MLWDTLLFLLAALISSVCVWSAVRKFQVPITSSPIIFCLTLALLNLGLALQGLWPEFIRSAWARALVPLLSIIPPLMTFSQLREIHRLRQIEQDLKENEATFRVLFENGPDAIILSDLQTQVIVDCNENACRMNGRKREEMIGRHANELHQEDTASMVNDRKFREEFFNGLRSGKSFSLEVNHRYSDGSLRIIETNMSLVTIRGKPVLMGIDRDITDRKTAEQQLKNANETLAAQLAENQKLQELLREQALHDPLTGLYNRRFLKATLDRELARARRMQSPLSLLMLDVDFFKDFNDRFGHASGDLVLQAIAKLLHEQFRVTDVPCRYGGEEFLIVMPSADCKSALKRAEMLRQSIAELCIQTGQLPQVTASVGVASFPIHGGSADELLQAADDAMYAAKQAGRNTVLAALPGAAAFD